MNLDFFLSHEATQVDEALGALLGASPSVQKLASFTGTETVALLDGIAVKYTTVAALLSQLPGTIVFTGNVDTAQITFSPAAYTPDAAIEEASAITDLAAHLKGIDTMLSTIEPAIGEAITGATAGSVLFVGTGGILQQDNAAFFFDATNDRLGLSLTSPQETLHSAGVIATDATIKIGRADAEFVILKNNEGELQLRNRYDNANADLVVENLTITGTLTSIDSNVVNLGDEYIVLNNDFTTGAPTANAGLEVRRGDETNASLLWDELNTLWKVGLKGSETEIIAKDTLGNVMLGSGTADTQLHVNGRLSIGVPGLTTTGLVNVVGDNNATLFESFNSDQGNSRQFYVKHDTTVARLGASGAIDFYPSDAFAARLNTSGYLGLGTTDVTHRLTIVDTAASQVTQLRLHNESTSTSAGTSILFSGHTDDNDRVRLDARTNDGADGYFEIWTHNGTALTRGLQVDEDQHIVATGPITNRGYYVQDHTGDYAKFAQSAAATYDAYAYNLSNLGAGLRLYAGSTDTTDAYVAVQVNQTEQLRVDGTRLLLTKNGTADVGTQYDSHALDFQIASWNETANAESENRMRLVGTAMSGEGVFYRLSLFNNADTELLFVDQNGNLTLAQDLTVNGTAFDLGNGGASASINFDAGTGYLVLGGTTEVTIAPTLVTFANGVAVTGALDVTGITTVGQLNASDIDVTGTLQVNGVNSVLESRSLTINGTANEVTVDTPAQTLEANRTWTIGLPASVTLATSISAPSGSFTTADIDGGSIDGATVGLTTRSSGAFTTLAANGMATFTGGVTIGAISLQEYIEDVSFGGLTAGAGIDIVYNDTAGTSTVSHTDTSAIANIGALTGGTVIDAVTFDTYGHALTFSTRVLTTTDIAEGTNLYWTDARWQTAWALKSTTNLPEGTNLYFTNERVDDRVDALLVGGANMTLTYDDGVGSLTLDVTGLTSAELSDFNEAVDDRAAVLIQPSANSAITWVYSDVGGTLTPTITLSPYSTTNLSEGTNLYWTDTRWQTAWGLKTTTNLPEGSNLYFTDERVDDRAAALIQNGTGISWAYSDVSGTLTPTVSLAPFSTTNLAEGTNLYYTTARWDTKMAAASTTDLAEGTNLYFTDERVDDRVASLLLEGDNITFTYNDVGGTFTIDVTNLLAVDVGDFSEAVDDRVAVLIQDSANSALTWVYTDANGTLVPTITLSPYSTSDLSEGTNLYWTDARWQTAWGLKTTTNLPEGSNLYFTDERVDDRVAVLVQPSANSAITWTYDDGLNTFTPTITLSPYSTSDLSEGTNLYYTTARWDTKMAAASTSDLAEGVNLYYTAERVDDRVNALIQTGTGISWAYDDGLGTLTPTVSLAPYSTTDLAEGTNLYWTDARWQTAWGLKSTTNLPEGSNLYYTDARVDARLDTTQTITAAWTFDADVVLQGSANPVSFKGGADDHVYIAFFADAAAQSTRSGWIGFGGTGTDVFSITNEQGADVQINNHVNVTGNFSVGGTQVISSARVLSNVTADTAIITSGTFADARISQTSVTQHEAALTVTAAQVSDFAEASDDRVAVLVQAGTGISWAYNDTAGTLTPTVTLAPFSTSNLSEGSNLYYTTARWDTRLATKTTTDLAEGSNLYFTNERVDDRTSALIQNGTGLTWSYDDGLGTLTGTVNLGPYSTTNLSEGSNLYFTDERVDDRVALLVQDGTGISFVYNDTNGTLTPTVTLSPFSTSNLSEGSNLYYTTARWDTRLATKTTSDLAEGANLYHTPERVDDQVSTLVQAGTGISWVYDDGAGTLTPTVSLSPYSTSDLSEGTNLYFTDARVDARITGTWRALANGLASLGADGKIPVAQLPALAITDTFTVANQTAMLALTAQTGDIAIRTDELKTYILSGSDPAVLGDWSELATPTDVVLSVNGYTGTVVIDTDDIAEGGSNLYFTDERVDDRLSTTIQNGTGISWSYSDVGNTFTPTISLAPFSTTNLSEGTNLYYTTARWDTKFAAATTTGLAEGSNLYFTDERVDDRVAALVQSSTGISWVYSDVSGTLTPTISLAPFSTSNLAEGSNLYYTSARWDTKFAAASTSGLSEGSNLYYTDARWQTAWGLKTTTNLPEGTNLYFTDERVDDRVAAIVTNGTGLTWTYNDTAGTLTGVVSLSPYSTSDLAEGTNLYYTQARFDSAFTAKSTTDLSEGTNLYFTDERVDDRVSVLVQNGTGISFSYSDVGGTFTPTVTLAPFSTTDLSEGTNLYYTQARFDSAFTAKSTTDLSEGSNLYYTDARVDARLDTAQAIGAYWTFNSGVDFNGAANFKSHGVTLQQETTPPAGVVGYTTFYAYAGDDLKYRDGTGTVYQVASRVWVDAHNWTTADITDWSTQFNSDFDTRLATKNTGDLTEGANLYYTTARANSDFDTRLATKSTTNLAEGTNLYFTNARVDSRITGTWRALANGLASLGADGKIPQTQLPALALTTTSVVANEAAQLALTAEEGDVAIRTDENKTYIHNGGVAATMADWDEMLTPTDQVSSVNGYQGTVVLDTDDIAEGGSNLYHTSERVDDRVSALIQNGTGLTWTYSDVGNTLTGVVTLAPFSTSNLSEGSNLYYTQARFDSAFTAKSTTNLSEGTNLYFTDERVDDRVAALMQDGTGISFVYSDAGGTLTPTISLTPFSTTNLSEGTNLYYTQARFDSAFTAKTTTQLSEGTNLYWTDARFDTRLGTKTTTNLAEGSNLYFTDERVDDRVAVLVQNGTGISFAYNDTAGTLTPTVTLAPFSTSNLSEGSNLYYTTARWDTKMAAADTGDLAEGVNLYYTDGRADARIAAQKGAANGLATLDGSSKIPTAQLPAMAITETSVVADQTAQLALTAQEGDLAVRTDENKSYIHNGGVAGTMADWTELLTPTDTILSVNGYTGVVVLTTSDITEGSNLYYTQARFDSAFTAKSTTNLSEGTNLYYTTARWDTKMAAADTGDLAEGVNLYYTQGRFDSAFTAKSTTNLSEGTNLYYTQARFDSAFTAKSTTDLSEGTNLYHTSERVDDRVAALIQNGTGLTWTYNDTNGTLTGVVSLTPYSTNDLAEGSNLYYTQGRFDGAFTAKSTTNLSEGTNLYYTDERVDDRVSVLVQNGTGISFVYNDTAHTFTPTVTISPFSTTDLSEGSNLYYTQARFDAAFTAKSTTGLSEGTNLYYTDARVDARIDAGQTVTGAWTFNADLSVSGAEFSVEDGIRFQHEVANFTGTAGYNKMWGVAGGLMKFRDGVGTVYTISTVGHTHVAANITDWSSQFSSDFDTRLGTKSTTNLAEGTNLYYTTARANSDFDTRLATKSTSDVAEGTSLYFTNERVDDRIDVLFQDAADAALTWVYNDTNGTFTPTVVLTPFDTGNLSEGVNLYYTQARFDSAFTAKSTTNLSEGTNLYFTDERVDDRVAALIQDGTGLTWTYVDGSNTLTGNVSLAPFDTGDLSEGGNLYYTQGRFDAAFTAKDTGALSEGANLYYTDARVDARLDTAQSITGAWTFSTTPKSTGLKLVREASDVAGEATFATVYALTTGLLKYRDGVGTIHTLLRTADAGAGNGLDADLLDGQHGAYYLDAANLTGTAPVGVISQAAITQHEAALTVASTQVSDWAEAVDDRVGTLLVAGNSVTIDYNDGAGTITISAAADLQAGDNETITGSWSFDGEGIRLQNETVAPTGTAGYTTFHAESAGLFLRNGTGTLYRLLSTADEGAGNGLDADLLDGLQAAAFSLTGHTHALGDATDVLDTTNTDGFVLTWVNANNRWEPAAVAANLADLGDTTIGSLSANEFLKWNGASWINAVVDWSHIASIPSTFAPSAHTHTASEVTDWAEAVDDRVSALFVAGSMITLTYSDVANTFTVAHDNTSSVADSSNSGATVIQSLTFDGNGHVQTLATKTLTYGDIGAAGASHTHNASDINAGTLADGRLSSNVVLKDTAATITGIYTFSGVPKFDGPLQLVNAGSSPAGTSGYQTIWAEVGGLMKFRDGTGTIYSVTTDAHTHTIAQITNLSSWTGSTALTTLGNVDTGTWQANPISSAYLGSHVHTTSDITTGGTYAFGAGTVGAPSMTIAGSLTSGVYAPGADQLSIATAGVERLAVNAGGDIYTADGAAELATTATAGFFWIATMNGEPTGTPANLRTGQAPMVIDRSSGTIYAYYDDAWNPVGGGGNTPAAYGSTAYNAGGYVS